MKIELGKPELKTLIDIVLSDIAYDEHGQPDYTDAKAMQYCANRASILKDLQHYLSAARDGGLQ